MATRLQPVRLQTVDPTADTWTHIGGLVMLQTTRRIRARNLALAVLLLAAISSRAAEAGEGDWAPEIELPGPQVELFLSSLFANSVSEGSLGVRGAFFLGKRFALEGSVARIADSRVDLWLLDVSAKYYVKPEGRTRIYFAGGPGLFLSDELDANEPTLHLGFGAEFGGRKFYFRPELRGRFLAEDVDANFGDLALGFGWRF